MGLGILIALTALVPRLLARTADGFRVLAVHDPSERGYPAERAEKLEIWKGRKIVATIGARTLIGKWLNKDAFWGGRKAANDVRYLDAPNPQRRDLFQGFFPQAIPFGSGILVRLSMFNCGPSVTTIYSDAVLRWEPSHPTKWEIFDIETKAGWPLNEKTNRFPVVSRKQYLVSGKAIEELSPRAGDRKVIAPLLTGPGWYSIGQRGNRILLKEWDALGKPSYQIYETTTRQTRTPSRTEIDSFLKR